MALLPFLGSSQKDRRLKILSGEGMAVKINLDEGSEELTSGYQCISGNVKITHLNNSVNTFNKNVTAWDFIFFRVQVEGIAKGVIRNTDKLEKEKVDKFLFPEGNAGNPHSHLVHYFIKPTDKKEVRILPAGEYVFPFGIQLQGENFPAEYSGPYGSIEYTLIAYIGMKGMVVVEADEVRLSTKGYINLALDPSLDRQITLTKKRERRLFSSSDRNTQHLQVKMILNKRGFIPGELVKCSLQVDNPLGERIGKLSVTLVQRIVNCISHTRKFTVAPLDSRQVECETTDDKIQWDAEFPIPENILPTFTRKRKTLEILYFLQFVVDTSGAGNEPPSQCKGETMVVIGTARDENGPKEHESRMSSSSSFDTISLSKALDDCWDTISVQSYETAPPAYSALSSRRSTLETLPPAYSDIRPCN